MKNLSWLFTHWPIHVDYEISCYWKRLIIFLFRWYCCAEVVYLCVSHVQWVTGNLQTMSCCIRLAYFFWLKFIWLAYFFWLKFIWLCSTRLDDMFFVYLVKSDLYSLLLRVHWTSRLFNGTRNTRPHPVCL